MTKPTKWHPPSLIRVFAVRMKEACVLSYMCLLAHSEDSDQTDLSSLGAQSFCWFCHEAAHWNSLMSYVNKICDKNGHTDVEAYDYNSLLVFGELKCSQRHFSTRVEMS